MYRRTQVPDLIIRRQSQDVTVTGDANGHDKYISVGKKIEVAEEVSVRLDVMMTRGTGINKGKGSTSSCKAIYIEGDITHHI